MKRPTLVMKKEMKKALHRFASLLCLITLLLNASTCLYATQPKQSSCSHCPKPAPQSHALPSCCAAQQQAPAITSTEVKPPVLADAIVEVTETGSSLRANRLRIIDTVMESYTQVIANPRAMREEWKREKISNLALMLCGAIAAQGRVGLMLNVKKEDLDGVLGVLPALKRPTISELAANDGEQWVAVNTIIEETTARDIIPKLKAAKAQGIVEYPLNKIVM